MKKWFVLAIVVTCLTGLFGPSAHCQEPYTTENTIQTTTKGEAILLDALLFRPVGLALCVLGLAGTIVTAPFAVTSESQPQVYGELIEKPFNFTFKRPLGNFE